MGKISTYEALKSEVAKTNQKIQEIKPLIKATEENFLATELNSEVWLDDIIYDEKRGDLQVQYYIGYVPGGDPGIMIKTVIRDRGGNNLIDSKTKSVLSIDNSAVLKEAVDHLYPLLQHIKNVIIDHKRRVFEINTETLEALASKDFGRDLT